MQIADINLARLQLVKATRQVWIHDDEANTGGVTRHEEEDMHHALHAVV
jgi:hypothetical protein